MRKIRLAAALCAALAAFAGQAQAGYISTYGNWKALTPDGQAAYAMAIFDTLIIVVAGDKFSAARATGLRECAKGLDMKAGLMARAMTKWYVDNPDKHSAPPFAAFNAYVERGACSPFINAARAKLGLQEMKKE